MLKNQVLDFNRFCLLELSENSTLYHYSEKKMKVGDVIKPRKVKGTHWLAKNVEEITLEHLRKTEFSDKPSRLESIYTSVIPRSRFVDKGYLYVVKPQGNFFMTDSTLIDNLGYQFYRELDRQYGMNRVSEIQQKIKDKDYYTLEDIKYCLPIEAYTYWEGTQGGDLKDLEVLCDSAVITEGPIEDERLKANKNVEIIKEGLIATMSIYFNSIKSKRIFSEEEAFGFINKIKEQIFEADVKVDDKEYARKEKGTGQDGSDEYVFELRGKLRKGAKLKTSFVNSALYTKKSYSDIPKRYNRVSFDFYLDRKLIRRKDQSPSFRFEVFDFANDEIWDISTYMKF